MQENLPEKDLLIRVAQIANSSLSLKEIIVEITALVARGIKKDACSVYLLRPDRETLCVEAAHRLNGTPAEKECVNIKDGIIGRAAREQRPIAVKNINEEPFLQETSDSKTSDLLSILAIPILRDSEILGVLTVQKKEPYAYSQDEITLLTIVSHNLSTVIKNAKLSRNFSSQLEKLKTIHEVGKAITSILSIDKLLPYICEEVSRLFNARGCILRLLEGENLQIKASFGLPDKIKQAMNLRLGEGIAGWVAQTGEPLLVDDVSKMPENLRIPVIEATSVLCIPLKIGERTIGTLGLYDKKDEWGITTFKREDKDTLSTFASASSIAIENARLYNTEVEKEKKISSLYDAVTQTKDYLESIIENSADAIIISDTEGIITSWNKGAEKIYGYTVKEVLGKFLPMVPSFLIEAEKKFIEKIIQKETIKNIETIRQTKSGKLIEVSLTLSPIIDSFGKVTGISGISRDISEKKRVEKELIRKNQELSRLFFINSAVRSTLELDRLLRMVLTVVTMGDGLGFNRAILFLVDETHKTLKGVMGVGPTSPEEAGQIWLSLEGQSLETIIEEIESGPLRKDSHLDEISKNLNVNLGDDCILSRCVKEKRPYNIKDAQAEPQVNPLLIQQLKTEAFGVVPLLMRDRVIGIILVDNLFTGKEIKDEDLQFLMVFTGHIASAIENAKLFEDVSLARAELKNIFESISDLLYFTDKNYVIRNVNQAVIKKLGKPAEEIVGKKCYEIFHGKDKPLKGCPHIKTINTGKAFVEELKDPYLGGTFVVSSSPILDSAGNFVGSVNISRDITELHALRDRLAASERMAVLGEMAARVAHEIRNPLISVGGFARRLEKKLYGDLNEYAKIIVEEVRRLENILKEILSFVRSAKMLKKKVNLNELIDSTINFISSEILGKGNNLIKELSKSPIMTDIDSDTIKEAILNVITNANEATRNGTITVKTTHENNEAIIEVSDSGYGIKQDDLKHVFTPFFTTRPHGTGLGLAVTHRIIQEHKGRIDIESVWNEPGAADKDDNLRKKGGTTVKIYLPLEES